MRGYQLTPWTDVEVRQSQFFDDRLAIVFRPGGTIGLDTRMALVHGSLRERIYSRVRSELGRHD